MIEENGPFHVKDFGNTVYENVYAWNKVGHVLYMESPQTVGYSYTTDNNFSTDDDETASNNHNALIDFFTTKFPELKGNDFYITGESYGGIYIPTLAVLVASDTTNFPNFKGVAIGNGMLSYHLQTNTLPHLFFYHALMRQGLYDQVATQCCNGNPYTCDYDNLSGACSNLVDEMLSQADDQDPYNLYAVCYLEDGGNKKTFIRDHMLKRMDKNGNLRPRNKQLGSALPTCAQENNTVGYLDRQDVRTALHIPTTLPAWAECSDVLNYNRIYFDMTAQIKTLLQKNVRILIYNGDVDTACNVMMNEEFINTLGLTIQGGNVNNRKVWHYNGSLEQMSQCCDYISNVGGYYTKYNGLDFVTVRGSGHFVPQDKPREALQMIYNYVNQLDYSTPVPVSTQPQPLING